MFHASINNTMNAVSSFIRIWGCCCLFVCFLVCLLVCCCFFVGCCCFLLCFLFVILLLFCMLLLLLLLFLILKKRQINYQTIYHRIHLYGRKEGNVLFNDALNTFYLRTIFYMHHPTDRITHTTAFVTPVVEHWLEREIAQWFHSMEDRSDNPSHHERTPFVRRSHTKHVATIRLLIIRYV